MCTNNNARETRKQQYAKAEEFVKSVYQGEPPPYNPEKLADLLSTLHKDIAPDCDIDVAWLQRLVKRLSEAAPEIHAPQRTEAEWQAVFPRYPTTEDGFVQSFAVDDVDAIRQTLDKYGLVVVRALDEATCDSTVTAMFEEVNELARAGLSKDELDAREDIDPDQPWTWEDCQWPSQQKFLIRQPAFHPQAFANRVAPHLYKLFVHLWNGETKLRVSIDNWGVTRGSKHLLLKDYATGEFIEMDRYRWGKGIAPHTDYNPWLFLKETTAMNRNPGYQAVIALNDHTPGMGCHLTLPGGAKFLRQWTKEHGCPRNLGHKRQSHRPAAEDPIRRFMQEIPLRKGEMVIWSWGQLHATGHNASSQMRLHQYVRFFPAKESGDASYELHDRYAPQRILRRYTEQIDVEELAASLDPLGRRLIGLEAWPKDEDTKEKAASEAGA